MLKKFALFFAVVYSFALLALSLIKLSKLPKIEVDFGDKIFHFFAYMLLTVLWFYASHYQFKFKSTKALIFALAFSILFGIIVEVLQNSFTSYRSLDLYDILANTLGVFIMTIMLAVNNKIHTKSV